MFSHRADGKTCVPPGIGLSASWRNGEADQKCDETDGQPGRHA
jgi:hypothetical protein